MVSQDGDAPKRDIGNYDASGNLKTILQAGENHVGQVGTSDDLLEVTFSLDTSAYAENDILAATQEISNALRTVGGQAILNSLSVLDKSTNEAALDILFLRSNTSVGSENAAENISDGDGEEILTEVPFLSSDYISYANFSRATKGIGDDGMGQLLEPSSGTSLYIAAVYRDTAGDTYGASDIVVKIGLLRS